MQAGTDNLAEKVVWLRSRYVQQVWSKLLSKLSKNAMHAKHKSPPCAEMTTGTQNRQDSMNKLATMDKSEGNLQYSNTVQQAVHLRLPVTQHPNTQASIPCRAGAC